MDQKTLLLAAVAGITLGASTLARATDAVGDKNVHCWGINVDRSTAKCNVTKDHMAAMEALIGKDEYTKRYSKSETHGCGSTAKCGTSGQILNYTEITPAECTKAGGYLIEKQDGKMVARQSK